MSVKHLQELYRYARWANGRFRRLDLYQKFYDSTQYEPLEDTPFHMEVDNRGTYIPLHKRHPSVIYNLPKIVVTRSTRLLFGDKHFPKFVTSNPEATKFLQSLSDKSTLQATMLAAAQEGAIGSVAIVINEDKGRFTYDILNARWCEPTFDKYGDLQELFIRYPLFGYDLLAVGYSLAELDLDDEFDVDKQYMFAKLITAVEETLFKPVLLSDYEGRQKLTKDDDRSITLDYGVLPAVWIRNLYPFDGIDGTCTYKEILPICVELDRQLSQCGRGLKYNSDPQLLIKEPSGDSDAGSQLYGGESTAKVRSTSRALFVGEGGDAKLLEINGAGQKAVLDYCLQLRQWALETMSASRKDPEHAYGNMSGRAMEILDGDLISLVAVMRLTYGEQGLKPLVMRVMDMAISERLLSPTVYDEDFSIQLYWGNWFDPTPQDLFTQEQALQLAVDGGRMFRHEGRMITATSTNVGAADPEKLEKEWPLPEQPKPEDRLTGNQPQKTEGRDGRDSKVTN